MKTIQSIKILAVALLLFVQQTWAQLPTGVHKCATVEYLVAMQNQDPTYTSRLNQLESDIQTFIQNNSEAGPDVPVVRIPVVVHVLYNNQTQNISDAQILSQIAVLNQDFRRIQGTNGFGGGVDAKIEFFLATSDPNGNSTTGITRTATSVTEFYAPANNMKFTNQGGRDAWSRDKYLNIWVCNMPNALGFAQFPNYEGTVPPYTASTDGVVIHYGVFGLGGVQTYPNQYDLGRTATHEVGHWLGLRHTWGDENNCNGTDYVADTPPCSGQYFAGQPGYVSCGGNVIQCNNQRRQIENYMDYSNDICMNRLTQGQSARMRAVLNLVRANLGAGIPVTVTQKTSTGVHIGTVTRWSDTSFSFQSIGTLPRILGFQTGTTERLKGDAAVYSNQKYNVWQSQSGNYPDRLILRTLHIGLTPPSSLTSQLEPITGNVSIRNELIESPIPSGGTIEFKDPWLIDFNDPPYGLRNRGMAAPFYDRSSPFAPDLTTAYPVQSGSATYKGVFLNQDPLNNPTYYSVRAQSTQTIGGYTGDFLGWAGVGATPSTPAALETPVVFTAPNAVVSARYKGRLLSSVAQASSQSGSQRRFARDVSVSSVFYLVYESAGKIWLTYTTNGGTSWQPERFIDEGTRPSLATRDNGVALAYTVADGAYAEVRVRLFALSGNTLSQTAYLYNNDWNAIPTASPAIVWLGNTFSQNPVLNNLPRYAVVYEAPATQGGTDLRAVTVIGSLSSPLPTTLSNSEVALANVQLFPAIDAMIPSTNYSPQSVQARLVYRQRSSSDGWLRYQPLTFNFSSTSVSDVSISQVTAQTLNWIGSGRAELAGNYPTKPSVEVKNNITYIAFEVEGKNDARYTTVNSSHQQGAVTIFSQTGEVLRAPSLHLQPNSTAPAIYFNMNGAVYEARWTAQSNWHIQKVATDGEHANIAVRSGNRCFVYTANTSAPFRLAFADGTTDGDAGSGGTQQERGVSGSGKGNTQSLVLNSGGGTSPSTALKTLERTTGVLSNQAESAMLALTLSDVGLNGSSRTGLTFHELGANLLPDTLALSPSNVFSLLKSRKFSRADTINQITATVKVHSKSLYDLTQNHPVQLAVELFNAATNHSIALSQTALVTASDTAKEIHFTMNLPTGQAGTEVELRVKVLGFAIQSSHKASALNEIELVSGTGGAAIVNRVGGQAAQTQSVGSVPTKFALHQNYPNPFNPTTVIRYELPSNAVVKVQVFDVLGRVLATLVNERREAGIYEAVFNASGLSSGTYFYRLQAGSFVETKKMVLVK